MYGDDCDFSKSLHSYIYIAALKEAVTKPALSFKCSVLNYPTSPPDRPDRL
jgi:hypothetical protein